MKLTLTQIRQLPRPTKGFTEYTVGSVTGLKVRVMSTGVRSWVFRYKSSGKQNVITLGRVEGLAVKQAEDQARVLRQQVDGGRDPAEEARHEREANIAAVQAAKAEEEFNPTFKTFAAEFIERYSKRQKKTWRDDLENLERHVTPHIGSIRIKAVTQRDIIKVLDRIRDRGADIQANRVRSLLHKMFEWSIARTYRDTNPVTHTERAKEKSRSRVLTEAEIRKLWANTGDSTVGLALRMCLLTGKRSGEVTNLRWSDIYDGAIHIQDTKNGTDDVVPVTVGIQRVLDDAKCISNGSEYVFLGKCGGIADGSMSRFLRRMDWGNCKVKPRPHDLRRTAATMIGALGNNRTVLAKLLNHTDRSVTGVYDRGLYLPEKRKALDDLWGEIQRIVGLNVVDLRPKMPAVFFE